MTDITKLYYDQNGFLAKTVFVTNEINYDHTIHDEAGLTGVALVKTDYQNSAPAISLNGLAYADVHAVAASKLAISNPTLSAKILANNADPNAATLAKFNAIMAASVIV